MTAADYIAFVNAVLARYPDACMEYPTKLRSVSKYPGGSEISRRCRRTKTAWVDAFQHIGKKHRPTGPSAGAVGTRNSGHRPAVRSPLMPAAAKIKSPKTPRNGRGLSSTKCALSRERQLD
jgi:hypothetical protein